MKKNNLGNIQKLNYCGCKFGNKSTCGNIATYQVSLCKRGIDTSKPVLSQIYDYRCETHKLKGTVSTKVFDLSELDQSSTVQMIKNFLIGLVGKNIISSFHTARQLQVKYVKDTGIMCFQPISRKWKFVYYEQIETIL